MSADAATDPEPYAEWPEPGAYRHFKGGSYTLVEVALHSETEEAHAVYRAADGRLWVRPLAMWSELVDAPDGSGRVPRFAAVGEH